MRRHKKTCCVCRQWSKNFENVKELKDHNCTNLSDRKVVSTKNKAVSSSEEGSVEDKTASCSSEASIKKKSLKIKLCSHNEATTYLVKYRKSK